MKILVIGSGGREHAIAWKLSQDDRVEKIYAAPGNGGTACENKCENINIKADDFQGLIKFVKENNIELTVVGPEDPLSKGIVDTFEKEGLLIFGPNKAAAMMEASKAFAKDVMKSADIATADYAEFTNYDDAAEYVKKKGAPIVVKADGLAAGKGVTVALSVDEALNALKEIFIDKVFGAANNIVVIEDFMEGEEATYLAVTDGEKIIPLSVSQDHKRVYDDDKGPNTGGMGAYAPAPVCDSKKMDYVTNHIAYPMIKELKKRGITYKGVIYAGLMINGESIKVVEFNCRFGDPECQVVLSRIENGFLDALVASAKGSLGNINIINKNMTAACVILISGGYPKEYKSGYEITGISNADGIDNIKVFHAGTKLENDKLLTNGGRVLCVTAIGNDLKAAIDKAYEGVAKISFKDMAYRKDIGKKGLNK